MLDDDPILALLCGARFAAHGIAAHDQFQRAERESASHLGFNAHLAGRIQPNGLADSLAVDSQREHGAVGHETAACFQAIEPTLHRELAVHLHINPLAAQGKRGTIQQCVRPHRRRQPQTGIQQSIPKLSRQVLVAAVTHEINRVHLAQNRIDRQLAGCGVMHQRIDCEGIGLVCEDGMPVGDDATLADCFLGLVEVGWIVVGERRLVEAGVLRFDELLDAEELHVAVDRAAHLFTEDQQVLLVRKGMRLAGDELGVADVVAHVVGDAEVGEIQVFGTCGQQGVGDLDFDGAAGVQMDVRIARVPTLLGRVRPPGEPDGDFRVGLEVNVDAHRKVFDTSPELQAGCARRQCHDKAAIGVEIGYRSFGLTQDAPRRRIWLTVAAEDAHPRRDWLAVQHAHGQLLCISRKRERCPSHNPSDATHRQNSFQAHLLSCGQAQIPAYHDHPFCMFPFSPPSSNSSLTTMRWRYFMLL